MGPRSKVSFQFGKLFGADLRFRMQCGETWQRHGAQLNHVDSFEERGLLHSYRLAPKRREVKMLSRVKNVFSHQPITRLNFVEPCETSLV